MPISEIPAKMVESAAGLTGRKMEIARDLFKIAYEGRTQGMKVEEIVKKYKEVFDLMKDITPPEQTTHFLKRHKISFHVGVAVITFLVMTTLSFLFHQYWEHIVDHFVRVSLLRPEGLSSLPLTPPLISG